MVFSIQQIDVYFPSNYTAKTQMLMIQISVVKIHKRQFESQQISMNEAERSGAPSRSDAKNSPNVMYSNTFNGNNLVSTESHTFNLQSGVVRSAPRQASRVCVWLQRGVESVWHLPPPARALRSAQGRR